MRPIAFLLFVAVSASAAPTLEVVKAIIAQSDGGAMLPAGFDHVPGETLFFSCRIAGYAHTSEEKVHLAFSVQAFDPQGLPLVEIYKNEMVADVSPQDKEWMPRIATELQIPPLVATGTYKLLIKVEDLVAKTTAELAVPFNVRGREVPRSDTLVVRGFHFYRAEEDVQPAEKAAFKAGDPVFMKFDITGFKFGEKNRIDVSYVMTFLSPTGKVMWTQPEPAVDQSESFYPKRYVEAAMGITLLPTTKPGEYTIGLSIKDGVGGQTYETKQPFTVE